MIRWIKLLQVAEKIVNKKLKVTITSELENWRGLCVKEGGAFHILLNIKWAKTERDIIKTMAHELAHIKHPNVHDNDFQKEMEKIYQQLKIKMRNTTVQHKNKNGKKKKRNIKKRR